MPKRTHRNTKRLTARERAYQVTADIWWFVSKHGGWGQAQGIIERAFQAHARQALACARLRQKGRRP